MKRSFSLQYQVNINAFNVASNPIIMPPTVYSSYNTTLKGMQTCLNVLVQIYTSAYFDMGLFTKALEIIWAIEPMYMKYIFLCEGGMHLLITGFASIGYLHGKARLGELSFEFEFVCSIPGHTRLLF